MHKLKEYNYALMARYMDTSNRVAKRMLRTLRKRKNRPAVFFGVVLVALTTMAITYKSMPTPIDPAAYRPLLNTIAEGESKGNYNAYFGNVGNATVQFTDMTIQQVLAWQEQYVADGSVS